MIKLNRIPSVPVQLPRREIFARMKFNRHKTKIDEPQAQQIDTHIADAFALCRPAGVWARIPVQEHHDTETVLGNGLVLAGARMAALLAGSSDVVLMAATVGPDIVDAASAAVKAGQGSKAVIYDAVGSETADAALDWINDYVRQQVTRFGEHLTKRRFSPGYGDLGLEHQTPIHAVLELGALGVTITPRHQLVPEKSVIGIAGIEKG